VVCLLLFNTLKFRKKHKIVLINLFFTGQNYIKKLRRENEQLKREIWNLREEYERLENYVKSREQSENEEVKLYIYEL